MASATKTSGRKGRDVMETSRIPDRAMLTSGPAAFHPDDFLKVVYVDGRPHWIAHVAGSSGRLAPMSPWEIRTWRVASLGRRLRNRVRRVTDKLCSFLPGRKDDRRE